MKWCGEIQQLESNIATIGTAGTFFLWEKNSREKKKTKAMHREDKVFFIKKEKRSATCRNDLEQTNKVLIIRTKIYDGKRIEKRKRK